MTHISEKSKRRVPYEQYEEYGYGSETRRRTSTPSVWPWLLGALALSLLGLLAWQWSGRNTEGPNVAVQTQSPVETFSKLNDVKVGDINVGDLAESAVSGLRSSLVGIKDEVTAKAAMPGLTQAASRFDQLTAILGQMTPETRKAIAGSFASIRSDLNTLLDQIAGLPGVGPVIQPTVDAIRSKLDTLATV